MEAAHSQQPKLPNVMCGDHSSFIATEVTDSRSKELKPETEITKEKDKKTVSFHNISPCTSQDDRCGAIHRTGSDCGRRATDRRPYDAGIEAGIDTALAAPNRALAHAATGRARWAPHAVLLLALALLATHVLHATAAALAAALPVLKKLCQYCRQWTEEAWRSERGYNRRLYPLGLALLTALLYSVYCALHVVYCVNVWAIEPLYLDDREAGVGDREDRLSSYDATAVKVTNYEDIPPKGALVKRD